MFKSLFWWMRPAIYRTAARGREIWKFQSLFLWRYPCDLRSGSHIWHGGHVYLNPFYLGMVAAYVTSTPWQPQPPPRISSVVPIYYRSSWSIKLSQVTTSPSPWTGFHPRGPVCDLIRAPSRAVTLPLGVSPSNLEVDHALHHCS